MAMKDTRFKDTKIGRFGRFGDTVFGRFGRFEHSNTQPFQRPIQIMIPKSQYMRHIRHIAYVQTSIYAPYQRYKGLSSIPKIQGNRQTILDIKYSIYKHYIAKHYMFDMADMKVWI